MSWRELQNGSDIRGISMEGRPGETVNFPPERARRLGQAFAAWLSERTGRPAAALHIALGRDSRLSGPALRDAVAAGLAAQGCTVSDCGLASTPAMFMTTVTDGYLCDGAIMLTASHLPFNRNGMKFFTRDGGLQKADITNLLERAEQGCFDEMGRGVVQSLDFMSIYAGIFVRKVREEAGGGDRPLDGLHIVVDAGNGAGGFYVEQVLGPLGADTSGSQFLDPDGRFPNHVPNPEVAEAMASICDAVRRHQADFGIIFDTDVDRAAAVDDRAEPINRNRLIALASAIVLAEHPGTTVVTDSVTSDGLTPFIENRLGGRHHRFRRGYKNLINEAVRLNAEGEQCWLAIETSGHAAMRENYFLDDGAYLITKILIELARLKRQARELSDLVQGLREPAESKEFRIPVLEPDFKNYGNKVIEELEQFCTGLKDWKPVPNNHEGLRISCPGGWFLLRLSLHEPLLPLNIETEDAGGVAAIGAVLRDFFARYPGLDLSAVRLS